MNSGVMETNKKIFKMSVMEANKKIFKILEPYMQLKDGEVAVEIRLSGAVNKNRNSKLFVKYRMSGGEHVHGFKFVSLTMADEGAIFQELRKIIVLPKLVLALVIRLKLGSLPKITAVWYPATE